MPTPLSLIELLDRLNLSDLDPRPRDRHEPPTPRELALWDRAAGRKLRERRLRDEMLLAYGARCACCGLRYDPHNQSRTRLMLRHLPPVWTLERLAYANWPTRVPAEDDVLFPTDDPATIPVELFCKFCMVSAGRDPEGLCAHERGRRFANRPRGLDAR